MPRGSVKDVKTKCRNMRKSNPRISQEVGKCEKSVSNIFMRAVRKLREYFNECEKQ